MGKTLAAVILAACTAAGAAAAVLSRLSPRPAPPGKDAPERVPAYIPAANDMARRFAKKMGGYPGSAITEAILDVPTTAHILGGCVMGTSPEDGVIDSHNRVFGYDNFYVVDGSMVGANLGVNPSLTITALAEHAMSHVPAKQPAS